MGTSAGCYVLNVLDLLMCRGEMCLCALSDWLLQCWWLNSLMCRTHTAFVLRGGGGHSALLPFAPCFFCGLRFWARTPYVEVGGMKQRLLVASHTLRDRDLRFRWMGVCLEGSLVWPHPHAPFTCLKRFLSWTIPCATQHNVFRFPESDSLLREE